MGSRNEMKDIRREPLTSCGAAVRVKPHPGINSDRCFAAYTGVPGLQLLEDKVCNCGFKIPINHSVRRQIKCRVRDHQHEEPTRESEDCSEDQADNCCLFRPRHALDAVMHQAKPD